MDFRVTFNGQWYKVEQRVVRKSYFRLVESWEPLGYEYQMNWDLDSGFQPYQYHSLAEAIAVRDSQQKDLDVSKAVGDFEAVDVGS